MKLIILLAAVALARADSSSSSTCIPTVSSSETAPLPPSIATAISIATNYAPDILTIGSIISTAELTSASLSYAESVVESYAHSYYSIINQLEEFDYSPTMIAPSSVSSFTNLATIHSTLANAVGEIVSFELSHTSFATAQSTIQTVMQTQSTILTDLGEYTDIVSPSISTATSVLAEATLTSPGILATVISIYTADASYPYVQSAISSLSTSFYLLPSTVDSEVITIISSPSTAPPSIVSSLSSCYPYVYSDVSIITEFTKSHSSVVTAITNLLKVASTVSSVSTAAYTVITQQMPTLTHEVSVVTKVSYSWPSFKTDIEEVSQVTATSETLSNALHKLESSFYRSPSVATSLLHALISPSTVTDPEEVRYEQMSHQSLVNAISEVTAWDSAHPSYAYTVQSIISKLTNVFKTQRSVVTAAHYVSTAASPTNAKASVEISSLVTIVPDITKVMNVISSLTYYHPTLSCDESVIESYANVYPTYVSDLWYDADSPSEIPTSSDSYFAYLEEEYSNLFYDMLDVEWYTYYYPSLSTYELSFIYAGEYDPYIFTDYYYFWWTSTYSFYASSSSSSS